MNSEAQLLWEDTLLLLKEKGESPSFITMLESCNPVSLTDEALTVSTKMKFVKRSIDKKADEIEACLKEIAFQPIRLTISLARADETPSLDTHSDLTAEEATSWEKKTTNEKPITVTPSTYVEDFSQDENIVEKRKNNPLVETISLNDSELTFDSFVEGEENHMALQAAKQVANGIGGNFNPLFIYGRSGLGKTHLLKAIYNYIYLHDPSRVCVYKTSREFLADFQEALFDKDNRNALNNLSHNYQEIDVLIIDDFQWLTEKERTIDYFFDIFNYLKDRDKQIVIAADRQPNQLGSKQKKMDERITSRVGGGFPIAIQIPDYELKLALIKSFYERMKNESDEGLSQSYYVGTISPELIEFMAERSGTNIRFIKSFCNKCLVTASEREQAGEKITKDDITRLSKESFPFEQKEYTIEEIQKAVEQDYDVNHKDLVGNKRNKELMLPRHVAIWLARNLTDYTLADIGNKFGGRSHATVKHSIEYVDNLSKEDRVFYDRVMRIREGIRES